MENILMNHLPGNLLLCDTSNMSKLNKPDFSWLVADLLSHQIVLEIFIFIFSAKYWSTATLILILCAVLLLCQVFLTVSNPKIKLFFRISLRWLSRCRRVLYWILYTHLYTVYCRHVYSIHVHCTHTCMLYTLHIHVYSTKYTCTLYSHMYTIHSY